MNWYQEAYLTRDGGPGGVICLWVNVRPTLLNGTLDDVPECWVHDGTMPENAVAIEITEDALDYDKLTEALQEGEMIDLRHGTKETE